MPHFVGICGPLLQYITPRDTMVARFCPPSLPNHHFSYALSIVQTIPMESSKKSTEFPDIQKAFLKSFIPEYEKYIAEHNPDHKPYSKELRDWRNEKARLLMQETCIQDLVRNSTVGARKWEHVCYVILFYSRHYFN
jgi:hypothetical protein